MILVILTDARKISDNFDAVIAHDDLRQTRTLVARQADLDLSALRAVLDRVVDQIGDDLLDAQWRGKMAISGVSTTAVNWVGTMLIAHGPDYVRKLGTQNIRIYNLTGRALANLMTAGEVMLSPTIYNSHVAASAEKGAPLGWFAPGPVPVTDSGVAIARKAPHPHAAMLFMDFLMSKEGQVLYQELGYDSPRTDAGKASAGARLERLYLTNRPGYIREYEDWAKLYQDVFVRRRI